MANVLFPELSYAVQGACFHVHNHLRGLNLSEEGWERALLIALKERGIPAQSQIKYELCYGSYRIGRFAVDVIVDEKLLLELKAVDNLLPIHQAQVLTYLRVTGLELGILVNFGETRVASQRLAYQTAKAAHLSDAPRPAPLAITDDLLYPELTGQLRSVLYTVHRGLGPGFMHMHYRRATQLELRAHGISYQKRKKMTISYQGRPIETHDTRLLIVDGKVVLACVAVSSITPKILLRMRQHLKLLGVSLDMIANFHAPQMEILTVRV